MEIKYIHKTDIHNLASPTAIIPFVINLVNPNSILDVGCGIGTWLNVFVSHGVSDVLGIDGDYVDRDLLNEFLDESNFYAHDLSRQFNLNRTFDLVLCLEVAEHLPELSSDLLINSLVNHSDLILFSAAIPGQGGQNHLNEQWPEYWERKFSNHGYVFLDIFRPMIWNDPQVSFWYKQNMFLVVKDTHVLAKGHSSNVRAMIHPDLYLTKIEIYEKKINSLQNQLAVHPVKRWLNKIISKL